MPIGDRIRYIRNLRGMTQKQLGLMVGFNEKNARIRITQYESGIRTPTGKIIAALADALEASPETLDPKIDSNVGVMHTLFALEDAYGLKIKNIDREICLSFDKSKMRDWSSMFDRFYVWLQEAEKLESGEITKEEYDFWRYNYPRVESERLKAKIDAYLTRDKDEK